MDDYENTSAQIKYILDHAYLLNLITCQNIMREVQAVAPPEVFREAKHGVNVNLGLLPPNFNY